jgi:hypothetical protein
MGNTGDEIFPPAGVGALKPVLPRDYTTRRALKALASV